MKLTSRCYTVLANPRIPSIVLSGKTGNNRRAALNLAAYSQKITITSPKIGRFFSKKSILNDLKSSLTNALSENEKTLFLIEPFMLDTEETRTQIFTTINYLVASGTFFDNFEFEQIFGIVRDNFGGIDIHEAVNKVFKIGILIDSEDVDELFKFYPNLKKFGANIEAAHEAEQQSSMLFSAESKIKKSPIFEKISNQKEICQKLLEMYLNIENTIPQDFSMLLNNFCKIYEYKSEEYSKKIKRFSSGLTKLKEASVLVDNLKSGASEKRHELGIKQKEADIALQNISSAMADASEQKQQMLELNNLADKEKRKIAERKAVIDEQLKDVQPAIDAAKEAVGCIRPKDLGEISALRAPPETVRDILEATLTLMGIFDTSWQTMKNFLRKRTFRDDIIAFDAREISMEARAQAKAKVKHCATSFTEAQAKRASTAAAPLAQWVKAQLSYALRSKSDNVEIVNNLFIRLLLVFFFVLYVGYSNF